MEKAVAYAISAFIVGFGLWILIAGLSSSTPALWICAALIPVAVGLLSALATLKIHPFRGASARLDYCPGRTSSLAAILFFCAWQRRGWSCLSGEVSGYLRTYASADARLLWKSTRRATTLPRMAFWHAWRHGGPGPIIARAARTESSRSEGRVNWNTAPCGSFAVTHRVVRYPWSSGSSRCFYTPAVRSSRMPLADGRQLSGCPRASSLLSQEVLQRCVVQHGVGQELLQPCVLVLQCPQPLRLRDVHPAEFGPPLEDAGVAHAVLAAQIRRRTPGLVPLQNPDDLLFRKNDCASCSGPHLGPERTRNWIKPVGQGQLLCSYSDDENVQGGSARDGSG